MLGTITLTAPVTPLLIERNRVQETYNEVSTFPDGETAPVGRKTTVQKHLIGGVLANRAGLGRRKIPRKRRRQIFRTDYIGSRKVAGEPVDVLDVAYEDRLIQVGQDIHDGPIQLLTILGIRFSEVTDKPCGPLAAQVADIKSAISDLVVQALSELRDISVGAVLHRLDGLTAEQTLRLAIYEHERATATSVKYRIDPLGFQPSAAIRICMFRIVQECLNNSYYYANGQQRQVSAYLDAQSVAINVEDGGSDSNSDTGHRLKDNRRTGFGLLGLQHRVEALGGTLSIESQPDGTRIVAMLPIRNG